MPVAQAPTSPPPRAPALARIREPVATDLAAVDALVIERLASEVALVNEIGRYIVASGGKRLRPLLVLLAARALGYDGRHHVALAAIVEFIHTATLLHDDVVDGSLLRRGRQTANAVWGNQASVLVGDFLYSRAFQMMVQIADMRVMEIMADCTNEIAEGEVLQLVNCHDPNTSEERYLQVIRSKTARLFEAAARVAAVIAGAPVEIEEALAGYGLRLGTAYQLVDDVLDYEGETETIGKNLGDDLAEGKPTLPLIHAMRTGSAAEVEIVRQAIRKGRREDIARVLEIVESTGAITYTARAAQAEATAALAALEKVPASPYREALEALAAFCVGRTY